MAFRRILLTGGQGFVGRHLTAALSEQMPEASIAQLRGDISDAAAVRAAVSEARPDVCLHLAAIAAPPEAQADPDRAWEVNLHGTLTLARALEEHAPGCVLLFVSSADAYGSSFTRFGPRLDESAPLAPLSVYGATKAAADLALGAMASGPLRIIRVRPFNHVGAGQSPAFVVANFARQIASIEAGRQPPVLRTGTLDTVRDFLDVRDVCRAYVLCLRHAAELPRDAILNIASGEMRTIRSILDGLLAQSDRAISVETDPSLLRVADIPRACGNADLAQLSLGWRPAIPWSETLRSVLTDWRERVALGVDG